MIVKDYMNKGISSFLMLLISTFMGACIHEHPDVNADNPSGIEIGVELSLDLKWGEDETKPFFNTKARGNESMRAVVEIARNSVLVNRDEFYITQDEIDEGLARHKLPFKLDPAVYEMAIWCDTYNTDTQSSDFDASSLREVSGNFKGIKLYDTRQCGYVSDLLDLRQYKDQLGVKLLKELSLKHAGARFRLITTDMRQFVKKQLNEIEKGETYTVTINYSTETADKFNAYSGYAIRDYSSNSITGPLVPTYSIYPETDLAEGFLFCDETDIVKMSVTVHNSARVLVVKSPEFSFEVKRGRIALVTGDFLSEVFSNHITVDNIWEGEIFIDL